MKEKSTPRGKPFETATFTGKCYFYQGILAERERLSTDLLLVLSSSDQLLLIMQTLFTFTKQASLIRSLTALSLAI